MKHIIHKAYWNWEREEKWLNDLSSRGLALTDYSWCRYVLEETPPGEYIYRIELLDHHAAHPLSRKYIEFVEGTGVEFVASYMRWVYFRKKAADGPFEIHSDMPSQIAHNKRVRALWLAFTILELSVSAFNFAVGLTLPISVINIICGALLLPLGFAFAIWTFQITLKIKRLKKEMLIHEG